MKTFYTVLYTGFGFEISKIACFDNLSQAKEFYKTHDFCNRIVVRNVKNQEKIKEFERICSYYKTMNNV